VSCQADSTMSLHVLSHRVFQEFTTKTKKV